MKILITNVWLSQRGGTEMYVRWLSTTLHRMGHEVTCFTPVQGEVSEEIARFGVRVTSDVDAIRVEHFDVIHAHHRTPSAVVRQAFPDTPMIFVAHGTEPAEEQPQTELLPNVRYLAISEGVQHNLRYRHGITDVDVIRNPIDMMEFRSHRSINAIPQRAILLKNAIDAADFDIMATFFRRHGIEFDVVGAHKSRTDVVGAINEADVVISWGRGALEALACERAVIAYGHDHLVDGMITIDNFYGLRTRSFNGRVGRHVLRRKTLSRQLELYAPGHTSTLRRMVSWDHASDHVIASLLKHYSEVM